MVTRSIKIVDTTLRDGEQSAGLAFSCEAKVRIAGLLDTAGIDQIEAGIPAVGPTEVDAIQQIVANRRQSAISTWNRLKSDDIRQSMRCRPDIIHIGAPVSYAQLYVKMRRNKQWLLKELRDCVSLAREHGFDVTVGFEDASRADICFLVTVGQLLAEFGVRMIRYADTVGILNPGKAEDDVRLLHRETGLAIEIHTHNDLGLAAANAMAAAKGGAAAVDCTIAGIGERAGNCNLRDFLTIAHPSFCCAVNMEAVMALETAVRQLIPQVRSKS